MPGYSNAVLSAGSLLSNHCRREEKKQSLKPDFW